MSEPEGTPRRRAEGTARELDGLAAPGVLRELVREVLRDVLPELAGQPPAAAAANGDGGVQAVPHGRELHVLERRRLAGLAVRLGAHVPACRDRAAPRDGTIGVRLGGQRRGVKQENRRSGHKTQRHR